MWCVKDANTAIDYETGETHNLDDVEPDVLGFMRKKYDFNMGTNYLRERTSAVHEGDIVTFAVPYTKLDYQFYKYVECVDRIQEAGTDVMSWGYFYAQNGVILDFWGRGEMTYVTLLTWARECIASGQHDLYFLCEEDNTIIAHIKLKPEVDAFLTKIKTFRR